MGRFGVLIVRAILKVHMSPKSAGPIACIALLLALIGAGRQPVLAQALDATQAQPAAQAVPAAPAIPTVQTSRDYRIRQGDQVIVTVFGEPSLTPQGPLQVVQGGTIALPLTGNVRVGGLTTLEASSAVGRSLKRYVRSPRVTVALYAVGPIEALVLGNVKTPGKFALQPPARLTDVLAAAGGLGPTDGDLPDARVQTYDGTMKSISLQRLLRDGDTDLNVSIESGDTVYVPSPATFEVRVVGAVDKPGDVEMHQGDDLAIAIARAGTSATANPDLNKVAVTRVGPDGKAVVRTVDLYTVLKGGDLANDMVLQKNDLVFVPTAKKPLMAGPFADMLYVLRALVP
jgi:polysaccharide export outer membrane protein